jgi:acyl carrier protein
LQNIIKEDRVFAELKSAIVGAMGVDEELIKPESVLSRDLGAESLDFLDINYHLEQTLGFKMARYPCWCMPRSYSGRVPFSMIMRGSPKRPSSC